MKHKVDYTPLVLLLFFLILPLILGWYWLYAVYFLAVLMG